MNAKAEIESKFLDMPLDPIFPTIMDYEQIYTSVTLP